MMGSQREILLIGGPADGERVTALYGNGIIVDRMGVRTEYDVMDLATTGASVLVAVPEAWDCDHDRAMAALITCYYPPRMPAPDTPAHERALKRLIGSFGTGKEIVERAIREDAVAYAIFRAALTALAEAETEIDTLQRKERADGL